MREWLELGPVPSDEVCEQVGLSEYNPDKARKEVLVYQKQLETQFKDKLNLVKFGVKLFQHDFGPYYEVVVYYNSEDQEAVDAAFEIESSLPEKWTQESLIELSKKDNPCGTRKKNNPDTNKVLNEENIKNCILIEFAQAFGINAITKEDIIIKFSEEKIVISLKKPNKFDVNDVIEVIKDAIFLNKLAPFDKVWVLNSSVIISNLKKKNPIEKNGKLLEALEKINKTISLSGAEKQVLDVLIQFLRKQQSPNGKVIVKENRRSL